MNNNILLWGVFVLFGAGLYAAFSNGDVQLDQPEEVMIEQGEQVETPAAVEVSLG